MTRCLLCTGLIAGLLLTSSSSEARQWTRHSSKAWGISFSVPKGTKMMAKSKGRWGGVIGKIGKTRIVMLGYRGLVNDLRVAAFAANFTGIPMRHWKKLDSGHGWHGFRKYATYYVRYGNRTLIAALLRHGRRPLTYLVFVEAPNRLYRKYASGFKRFGKSFWAL